VRVINALEPAALGCLSYDYKLNKQLMRLLVIQVTHSAKLFKFSFTFQRHYFVAVPLKYIQARRLTGYIPTPANANFALGSDAVKVLYPATRWSRGRNPIGLNTMKIREAWNTDQIL